VIKAPTAKTLTSDISKNNMLNLTTKIDQTSPGFAVVKQGGSACYPSACMNGGTCYTATTTYPAQTTTPIKTPYCVKLYNSTK
jgi:hypothetical protein